MATTFDFPGFTHLWARSRKGKALMQQQTARSRLVRDQKGLAWTSIRPQHSRARHPAVA
jgi:hypothetical protein